jgi:hypothetical protein
MGRIEGIIGAAYKRYGRRLYAADQPQQPQ